jgi:hypothetical protein
MGNEKHEKTYRIFRPRLDPANTSRATYWALTVIKMYLHGERHGYVPEYPREWNG